MDEIVSDSNFAFGIPSKTSKNNKKNKVMKHTEATSVEDINNHFSDGYGYEELEVTLPVYDRE